MSSNTATSRAVFFGVSEFCELPPLKGVAHNVPALRELLTSNDVGGLAEEECVVVPESSTCLDVLDALQKAAQEATDLLLFYYAGHGHFGGPDRSFLLATRDSGGQRAHHSVDYHEIRDLVSKSRAQRKVVVIDCCFSGRALSMSDEQAPTRQETEISGACVLTSAAETEQSICQPDGSVFTLELTKLLREGLSGPLSGGRHGEHLAELTMSDVFDALHSRLKGKTVDGHRVPLPKLGTRDAGSQIVLARNRAYSGASGHVAGLDGDTSDEHEWVTAARDHPLWSYVSDNRGLALLRDTATAMAAAAAVATGTDSRDDDPWRSRSFTERLAEWTDSLLLASSVRPEELELSAAEVFLLVTHPYLHTAFWQHNIDQSSTINPTDLTEAQSTSRTRRDYELFLRSHPRLIRRAQGNKDRKASNAIGWWIFHRWLVRQVKLYSPSSVEALLDRLAVPLGKRSPREKRLIEDVLEARLIARLLRAPQLPGSQVDSAASHRTVGAAETAQRVRTDQLAELLRIAHLFAIDPIALPGVVVDHIGIGYAVDLPGLHRTLERFRWESNGRTWSLSATCSHLAVELGLRQHVSALSTLLARIDIDAGNEERPALLRNLPLHVTADQVTPAEDDDERRAYEPTELRFRLADDRIQELLMGEELYGDPALAIRELYQNALDACRYRQARTQYLRATGTQLSSYKGTISFTQGTDEKGPYLECRDNGIGMGEGELRDVYSHAGMRFADLPEFIEEHAKWSEHDITMHPNSQFGVGVLSYFMLADDITVTTCRLTREGLPGEHLRVEIAGPGSLFRIQRLERCPDAYTSVRLRLRSPETVSCVDVLRRILWLSEFDVMARDDTGHRQTWEADVLGDRAPLGAEDPYAPESVREDGAVVIPTSTPAVWWCNTNGAVLADGLWAGQHRFGAVVNLSGKHVPRLTVDRRRIIDLTNDEVERLLRNEIQNLLTAGDAVFRHDWLARVLNESAELADSIFTEAVRMRFEPWLIAGRTVDIAKCGYFPEDPIFDDQVSHSQIGLYKRFPPRLVRARMEALTSSGFFPKIVAKKPHFSPFLPSDVFILLPEWVPELDGIASRRALLRFPIRASLESVVARLARPTSEIKNRLKELGFDALSLPHLLKPDDRLVVSRGLDGIGPWLNPEEPVRSSHVLRAAEVTGRSMDEVAEHLRQLGFVASPVLDTDPMDLRIMSRDLDEEAPWLDPQEPVRPDHALQAAEVTGWSVEEVAERLRQLGFVVPSVLEADPMDPRIMSQDLDEEAPWLDPQEPVHPGHVLAAAEVTGWSVEEVAERLRQLGFVVPSVLEADPTDLRIMSRDLDGQAPWLSPVEPVYPDHILRAARITGRTLCDIATQLTTLGYKLPEFLDVEEGEHRQSLEQGL
ncbi:caspase, EACC1-associated type [Streptomyces sp. NPDC056231]|uniref:caspase, EACC1-associated type n=1 Tax=Streptomyces sp. NPDC056231 TaxID=3345755 RepID=UPI003AAD63A6